MAFCLFAAANGQNVAGESGTFVDVTPNVQTQLDGRFGTAPSHRSGHTMTRVDEDTAVVFGGLGPFGTLNDVWEFRVAGANWTLLHAGAGAVATSADPSSDAASLANAAPSPRVGHCAVVLRGDLYVFGGYDTTRGHTNDVWVFKRADGTWRPVSVADGSPFPSPRSGAGAVAPDPSGATFVIFGGDGKDDVWAFDVDTGVWTMRQGESVAVTSGGGRGASSASRARAFLSAAAMLFAFDAML